jgi:hypothetical protein
MENPETLWEHWAHNAHDENKQSRNIQHNMNLNAKLGVNFVAPEG